MASLSIHMAASVDANAGSPPKPPNAFGGAFPPLGRVTSDIPLRRNPAVHGTKVLPALNAPTKALKNARIRRPFKGDAQSLAADVRGRKHHNSPLWDHNLTRTCIASDEAYLSGYVSQTWPLNLRRHLARCRRSV